MVAPGGAPLCVYWVHDGNFSHELA